VRNRNRALAAVAIITALLVASQPMRPRAAPAVQWTDFGNAAVVGGELQSRAACDGCAGGARSVQTIDSRGGYIEFTPSSGSHLFAGLGTHLTSSTAYSEIEFAFGFWPDGGWDIREGGVYRAEGHFLAGDRFKLSVEAGAVKDYRNGALVFSSAASPEFPLVFDVAMLSASASLGGATLVPSPTRTPTSAPVTANPGPYDAIIDRIVRPKPVTPAPPAAGGRFTDTAFGTRLLRDRRKYSSRHVRRVISVALRIAPERVEQERQLFLCGGHRWSGRAVRVRSHVYDGVANQPIGYWRRWVDPAAGLGTRVQFSR
jgi:hypothetical protein